jgi:hypothetical protein
MSKSEFRKDLLGGQYGFNRATQEEAEGNPHAETHRLENGRITEYFVPPVLLDERFDRAMIGVTRPPNGINQVIYDSENLEELIFQFAKERLLAKDPRFIVECGVSSDELDHLESFDDEEWNDVLGDWLQQELMDLDDLGIVIVMHRPYFSECKDTASGDCPTE